MKDNQDSLLDIALYLIQTYLPHKKPLANAIKLKSCNRKVTITLGKWATPYLKYIKKQRLIK